MKFISEFFSSVWASASLAALVCLVIGYWLGQFSVRIHIKAINADNESLRDEIWALRDQAAARNKAEAASDAKSRFLATVSHEIRTPLNGILGLTDLLRATELTREQTSYIEAIHHSGEALTSIIHEILDFSRIEAGHLDLNPEIQDLNSLVEGVTELMAPRAQGKGIEIAALVSANLPQKVVFDAARLRQVLLNLTGNAIKFTEKGGVGIQVELFEGDMIRFSIIDTGPGIPHSQRTMIFNEFETGDSSSTRPQSGTGLGLSISQRIVARMGGSLNLAESTEAGANFFFTIPLQLDPASSLRPPERLDTQRVLIVARSPFEAPFMAQRLREAGADVVLACDANSAVDLINGQHFDAIIVDCALGEADTEHLAQAAHMAKVGKALVLFSPFERHAFNPTVAGQFDGWLVKPVRAHSLLTWIWPQVHGEAGFDNKSIHHKNLASELLAPVAVEVSEQKMPLRVLLAEDDDVSALVERKMLESLGANVTLVRDGEEAMRVFEEALMSNIPFDLGVFDIRMPKFDGLHVARFIRLLESGQSASHCRLVALSANVFAEDKIVAEQAGFGAFLTKPIALNRLADVFNAHAQVAHTA